MTSLLLPRNSIALYTLGKTGNATPYSYKVQANFHNLSPYFKITTIKEKVGANFAVVDPRYYSTNGTVLAIKRWGPVQANIYYVLGSFLGQQITVKLIPQKLGS
jgi:hypothetical protein